VIKSIGLFIFIFLPAALIAQNPKSAIGGEAGLWAGGEASSFNPDWSCSISWPVGCAHEIYGAAALVDFNLNSRLGAEGEARWLHWHGEGGQVESNYLIGPHYRIFRIDRLSIWPKVLVGGGWITTPFYPKAGSVKGSYFVYAPGVTFDYRLYRHLVLRADYEYQLWPSFGGPPTTSATGKEILHDNGLTPNGLSLGVTYRFLGGR
jgi:hypothetical protein